MRLAVVLEQCLAPVPGGTGRYSRELAGALARACAPGDEVVGVTAWHRRTAAAVVPGVRGPHRLPLPRRGLVWAWEHGLPPGVPGDVVLAPTPLHPAPHRRPTVVVVHDAVPWSHPETLTPRGVAWHRGQVGRAVREAALVVVPTQAVADELGLHLPLREVLVVGEGVSADLVVPPDDHARSARLALPARFLLTVATLEPRKGLDVLLAALALPEAPDLPLLCAGPSGWGGLDLLMVASAAGLAADRVRLLGRVSDADLAVLYDRATAVVVPSRAEGFGLPLLEAMAAGTPVVTSDAPALVEVGGGAALVAVLTPAGLAGALRQVVDNEVLRTQLAARGVARAAEFSWDAAAVRLWTAVRAVEPTRSA